jgi:hypothetical protein
MTTRPEPEPAAPAAKTAADRGLVEAVELLDQLIEQNQETLSSGVALDPVEFDEIGDELASMPMYEPMYGQAPLILDLFGTPAADDFDNEASYASDDDLPEQLDLDVLRQELLSDLNTLIDLGLRRATDSARQRLSEEFGQELMGRDGAAHTEEPPDPESPEEPPRISLTQAMGDILSRYGLSDRDSSAFYRELKQELETILGLGLEQIRHNLEQVLQQRIAARAESQLLAMSAPRELQSPGDGLESNASSGDNPAPKQS